MGIDSRLFRFGWIGYGAADHKHAYIIYMFITWLALFITGIQSTPYAFPLDTNPCFDARNNSKQFFSGLILALPIQFRVRSNIHQI